MTHVKVNNQFSKSLNGLVNDLFNEFPTAVSKSLREDVLNYPPVNIVETPDNYLVELLAAGYDKADFKVGLDNNLLTISAEKKENAAQENSKTLRKEFSNRSFKRSFNLDEKIEAANITAKYENGILLLELPKREIAKTITKDIEIL